MHAEWKMPVKLYFQWGVFKAIPSDAKPMCVF